MLISATVENRFQRHQVSLRTSGKSHAIDIPPRPSGLGSAANGGELLCLAMATCYCNDIYREPAKPGFEVAAGEVQGAAAWGAAVAAGGVEAPPAAESGAEVAPAGRLSYRFVVRAKAAEASIRDLIAHTHTVA